MNTTNQDEMAARPASEDVTLGLRLRQAREARGMSVAEAAERLRLKSATIEALECEQFDLLGAPVYVRGYYSSYARLVGVPGVLVEGLTARRDVVPAPELHTTARISRSRVLFDRFARRSVYVVLTASIVVPVVLLATRDQLPSPGATLAPLDSPIAVPGQTRSEVDSATDTKASAGPVSPGVDASPTVSMPRSAAENPVVASLTPFYSSASAPPPPPPPPAQRQAPDPVPTADGLSLHFKSASWVEVLGRDGERLEYGLLPAGSVREFGLYDVARVSLGNAEGVEVRMNGDETDLAPFRRANVARFTVSSDGSLAPAGG